MKTYKTLLIIVLLTILTACNAPAPGATPTLMAVTDTPAPTEAATATSAATATPTLEPTEEAWLLYVNSLYGYQIAYPSDAQYLEHGVEGFPAEDLPENMTEDEYMAELVDTLGNNLCLEIQYGTGYVSVSAPVNDGFQYAICGPTGVGLGDITSRSETVVIGGQQYVANGREYVSEDESEHDETLWVILPDKTRITFGQGVDDPEVYDEYRQDILPVLLEIVESYDDSLDAAFDEDKEPVVEQEGLDKVAFEDDITVTDGTRIEAGETFTKTWLLRNDGETTWNEDFTLVFDTGDQMGGPNRQELTVEVPPGETVEISVELTAPTEAGEYTGLWLLEDEMGNTFGTGTDAKSAFWVAIVVEESATTEEGGTAEPEDANDGDGSTVTAATLTVDQTSYTGSCSVDLNFNGVIASDGPGSFTYEFQAGVDNAAFEFALPGSQDVTYEAEGSHQFSVSFTLTVENDVSGWAQLVISEPNDFTSNRVNFTVDCTN